MDYYVKGITSIPFLILVIFLFYELFGGPATINFLVLLLFSIVLLRWDQVDKLLKGGA